MEDEVKKEIEREREGEPASINPLKIVRGLSKPRDSREYKEALIGLQRLSAPTAAVLIPLVAIMILAVVSAVSNTEPPITTVIATVDPTTVDLPPLTTLEVPHEVTDVSSDAPVVKDPGGDPGGVPMPAPMPVAHQGGARPIPAGPTVPTVGVPGEFQQLGKGAGRDFGVLVTNRGSVAGALIGVLVDFKRDATGQPRNPDYWKDVRYLIDHKFTDQAFAPFYRIEKRVALTHLFIQKQPAENGPKAFGVEKLMKPKQWAAYYNGSIRPAKSGRYRFVGQFDDALVVLIDGRNVFEATWGSDGSKPGEITGWVTSSKEMCRKYAGPDPAIPLVYGDWFELDANKASHLDLVCGERPGGIIDGILMIEEEGVTYAKDAGGRPILPIFATRPLTVQDVLRLDSYASYKIGTEPPAMNFSRSEALKRVIADDVKVVSGL